MSLHKDRKQAPLRIQVSQITSQPDTLGIFERALDRAFGKFESQFQRISSILEGGLHNLADVQKRSIRRLDRLNDTMMLVVKQLSQQDGSNINLQTDRPTSLCQEDHDQGDNEFSNKVSIDVDRMASNKLLTTSRLAKLTQIDPRQQKYESLGKRDRERGNILGEEPQFRQSELMATASKRYQGKHLDSNESTAMPLLVKPLVIEQPVSTIERRHSQAVQTQRKIEEVQQSKESTDLKQMLARMGEYSDRMVLVPLSTPIEGRALTSTSTKQEVFSYIFKWIGCITDNYTKQAFNGYCTDQMSIDETKVFVCNHIILSFHAMMEYVRENFPSVWENYKGELISKYQEQQINALEYYEVKYPQKSKMFLSSEVNAMLKQSNQLSTNDDYNMLRRLDIKFNPMQMRGSEKPVFSLQTLEEDFSRKVKMLINAMALEGRAWFKDFNKLMGDMFSVPNPTDPTQRIPLSNTRIGMKFKMNMPLYSADEIKEIGVPTKSPEVLRVLIKWIDKLDEIVKEPQQHVADVQDYLKMGMNNIEIFMKTRYDRQFANCIHEHYKEEFQSSSLQKSILASAYNSLPDYIARYRSVFEYLPQDIFKSGMTVNLMSTLSCDVVVLALKKLVFFLYKMHSKAVDKVGSAAFRLLKLDQEQLPFTVYDILRAKFAGTTAQMQQVINNIVNCKDITVLRVKNRFDTGNRDYLINFVFKECKLICEVQVGLKESLDGKSSCQQKFNHFLYTLCRSRFGPLSEAALIMDYQVEVGQYFKNMTKRLPRNNKLSEFKPIVKDTMIYIDGYEIMPSDFTFLCNRCLKISSDRLFSTWKEMDKDSYLCGKCVYSKLNSQEKAIFALGPEIGKFYHGIGIEDENKEKSEYIAVVTSDSLCKIEYYSTREPNKPLDLVQSFLTPVLKDPYYVCFGELNKFFASKSYQTKKFFRLKKELLILTLRIEEPQPKKGPWKKMMKDLGVDEFPDNKVKYPYIDDIEEQEFSFYWTFSSSLANKPQIFETVRCAVDLESRTVLILDFERDYLRFQDARDRYLNNSNVKSNKRWMFDWNYENQNFDDALLQGLREDNVVQIMKMNGNNFTRINLFRSRSLERLFINHNKIESLAVDGNYPALLELSLIGNGLEVIDFTVLALPKLEILNLSNNRIHTLIWKQPSKKVGCPELKALSLRFNNLSRFEIPPDTFPQLQKLGLSFNSQLEGLFLRGFRNLKKLDASDSIMNELYMEGEYSKLDELTVSMTQMERCDLSTASMPKLACLSLNFNRLTEFVLPGLLSSVGTINLDHNFLTEVKMESRGSEMPRLRDITLRTHLTYEECNRLKKVDFRPMGICALLQTVDVSINDTLTLVFSRNVDLSQKLIKRAPVQLEQPTVRWMIHRSPKEMVDKFFSESTDEKINSIDFRKLVAMMDPHYLSNMVVSSQEEEANKLQMATLCKEFLSWMQNYPDLKPKLLQHDETEERECYFLQPKDEKSDQLESIISTMEIPLGQNCQICKKKLQLPYYYGLGSKTHRCIPCTEKLNEKTTTRLQRYIVNENSILIVADRVADKSRVGNNLQPKKEEECQQHSFICNGCKQQVSAQPRYICLGCRRQPNYFHSEPVDFCQKCATRLVGTDQQLKKEVMKNCHKDGHTLRHALLRVLYCVIDHKQY